MIVIKIFLKVLLLLLLLLKIPPLLFNPKNNPWYSVKYIYIFLFTVFSYIFYFIYKKYSLLIAATVLFLILLSFIFSFLFKCLYIVILNQKKIKINEFLKWVIEIFNNYIYIYIYCSICIFILILNDSPKNNQLIYDVLNNFLLISYNELNFIFWRYTYMIINFQDIPIYILNYFRYNYIYYYIEIEYIIWLLNKKNSDLLLYEPIFNINFDILLWIF